MRSIILIGLVGMLATSCGKEKRNDKYKECYISTMEFSAPSSGSLTYSVALRGRGKVTSVTYLGPGGPVTQTDPVLPFHVSLQMTQGAPINVSVVGTLSRGGNLSAGYLFLDSQGIHPVHRTTFCTN